MRGRRPLSARNCSRLRNSASNSGGRFLGLMIALRNHASNTLAGAVNSQKVTSAHRKFHPVAQTQTRAAAASRFFVMLCGVSQGVQRGPVAAASSRVAQMRFQPDNLSLRTIRCRSQVTSFSSPRSSLYLARRNIVRFSRSATIRALGASSIIRFWQTCAIAFRHATGFVDPVG